MHPALRQHHLTRIIEALTAIGPGSSFERFGARLMDALLPGRLVHRGLNVVGHPAPGTVDSISDDGLTVAEYSAERGYFGGSMRKASGDIVHAMRQGPRAIDIYLLSSQDGSIVAIDRFKARASGWPGMPGRTLHIYDARRIAETIVDDLLLNDAVIDDLAEYLPILDQLRDEHDANLTFPNPVLHHIGRPEVDRELTERLAKEPVVAVCGMGGSGKSEAATRFGADHGHNYHLRIWLEGKEVPTARALRSAPLRRAGAERNIAALLASHRCLLVLDDAVPALDRGELVELCGEGSHVILTRRQGSADDYALSPMGREQALQLLNSGVAVPCPEEMFEIIWSTVEGHALSLGIMNRLVRGGEPWSHIADDCNAVGRLLDRDGRMLVERLLGRLRPILDRELAVFAWAGSPSCDRAFIRQLVRAVGLRNLENHGVTTTGLPTVVRLHDVVFACLGEGEWFTPAQQQEFDRALVAYASAMAERSDVALAGFAATVRPALERLAAAGQAPPIVLIALLEAWTAEEFRADLIPEPTTLLDQLKAAGRTPEPSEVRLVIEALEGHQRHDGRLRPEQARTRLEARLPALEELAALAGLSDRQQTQIKHHWAKALVKLDQKSEAAALYEEILAGPHPMHEARLQLLRLYGHAADKVEEAAALAEQILIAAAQPGAVSTTVVLATLERLPWGKKRWRSPLLEQVSDSLEREIATAAAAGLDLSMTATVSVGRHWLTHDPERLARVLSLLPRKPRSKMRTDRDLFAHSELLRLQAQLTSPPSRALQEQAEEMSAALSKPNAFQKQMHAQLLIEMDRPADALPLLTEVEEGAVTGWTRYWRSVALLAVGKEPEALTQIDAALADEDHRLASFQSSFLVQRFKVRRALGDGRAPEDLAVALSLADDDLERRAVEELLARLDAI